MKRFIQNLRQHQKDNTFFWRILILATFTSMLISLMIGLQQSIWFDEAYSIMVAKLPVDKLLSAVALDTHPPLYYLVLKSWAGLFGWGDAALRLLSVLCYGGAMAMIALTVRTLLGSRAAVVSILFMMLAPFAMRYGFEIRMYAMGMAIVAAATYALVRARSASNQSAAMWWAFYAVLVALGMYSLYYTALVWIAHVVWLIIQTLQEKKPNWRKQPWLLAYLGSVVLYLPWLPTFFTQVNNGALAPISESMTLSNLMGILTFNFLSQPVWQLSAIVSVLAIFVVVTVPVVVAQALRVTKHRKGLLLLVLTVMVPILVLALIGLVRPMYVERYLSHVAPVLMAVIGASVWTVWQHRPSRLLGTSAALLLAVIVVGLVHLVQVGNFNFQRMQRPNMNEIARELMPKCQEGDAIVAADPYTAIELEAVLPNCQINFYSDTAELRGGYAPLARSEQRVENPVRKFNNQNIQYVYYGEPELRFNRSYQADGRRTFGPVTIAQFTAE